MPADPPSTTVGPLTRAEQQRRTREALVASARTVFAREGFHGATLETVARAAGLSKGAVYSNFDGKAALFLAVLDADLAHIDPETWEPTARYDELDKIVDERRSDWTPVEMESWGFGLATLEFIASAARDNTVKEALGSRVEHLRDAFTAFARKRRDSDDPLSDDQLAAILLVFDQGLMSLALAGWSDVDATMARRAIHRMLRPADGEAQRD
jgi:AcrR family transcriptional regulator